MVETLPLLDRLLHPVECYDAFDELDTLSRESPLDASAIAWNYLMKVDPWLSDMGIDALVVKVFLESTPDGSERLLAEWPQIDESPKRAICYGAYLAEAMPESLVVTLFFFAWQRSQRKAFACCGSGLDRGSSQMRKNYRAIDRSSGCLSAPF